MVSHALPPECRHKLLQYLTVSFMCFFLRNVQLTMRYANQCLPSLQDDPAFSGDALAHYLETYWSSFHIEIPLLHRPTFDPTKVTPWLLCAILAVGAWQCDEDSACRLAELLVDKLRGMMLLVSVFIKELIYRCSRRIERRSLWVQCRD